MVVVVLMPLPPSRRSPRTRRDRACSSASTLAGKRLSPTGRQPGRTRGGQAGPEVARPGPRWPEWSRGGLGHVRDHDPSMITDIRCVVVRPIIRDLGRVMITETWPTPNAPRILRYQRPPMIAESCPGLGGGASMIME